MICKGNARKFKQRVSGRRNSYGMVMGQRTGDWQSGCPLAFATYFRTNTHTLPNYRLPPNPKTHDDENCTRQCYDDERSIKVVQKLAQRASREMTGYHSGYTYKAQRTQKGTLDTAFQSLTYFEKNLQDKEPAAKYRRTVTKTAADFYHHTTARASTEEFNLAMNVSEHDVSQAEFIRTYRDEDFRGGALLRRYEFEKQHATKTLEVAKVLPTREGQRLYDFEDVYGFRPNVDEVFYLSPWEFCMFWHAISKKDGQVYTGEEFLEFPELDKAACLREGLILCRRSRPMVPCPQNAPMPESAKTKEEQSKRYSLYFRPWTLLEDFRTPDVPLITELDAVALRTERRRCRGKTLKADFLWERSFHRTWTRYIRGNVVSEHSVRMITQFMAANCGRSSTRFDDSLDDAGTTKDEAKFGAANSITVARLHSLISNMSGKAGVDDAAAEGENSKDDMRSGKQNANQGYKASSQTAMRIGDQIWGLEAMSWKNSASHHVASFGPQLGHGAASGKPSRAQAKRKPSPTQPHAYARFIYTNAKKWLDALCA